MKNKIFKSFLVTFFFCGVLEASQINIAVAANVSYAIEELVELFEKKNPQTKVRVTLGSSGKLTAQIKNGAPYGVFMSANMKYPETLYKEGLAITKPVVYAEGALAYLSNKEQNFSIGMDILREKSIKRIAVANPHTAPYGKAAYEAMRNAGVLAEVEKKFVYAESISQTVAYTLTAANLGFVAKSSLYSDKMKRFKEGKNWSEVDASLYTPIEQGLVLLSHSENGDEYRKFYQFLLSSEAKLVFQKYGYKVKTKEN